MRETKIFCETGKRGEAENALITRLRGPALTDVCGGILYWHISHLSSLLPLTRYSQNLVYEMRRTATVKPWNWNTANPASEST